MRVTTVQGDTLDRVAWRHLGTTTGVVEATLAAHPELAELGPELPLGTEVDLVQPQSSATAAATVSLWD